MSIITLLTDFGYQDPYVGIMKGVVSTINPDAIILDIAHDVPSFSVRHAAFSLFSYYKYYPKNTVHLVVVDPGVGSNRKAIAAKIDGNYYVLPDNGIITYIWKEGEAKEAYSLENKKYFLLPLSNTFHGRDIFSPVAAYISKGIDIKEFGPKIEKPVLFSIRSAEKRGNKITGEIIYTDKFGNAVANIPRELFDGESAFYVNIKKQKIYNFAHFYGEYKIKEKFSIFGSTEYLELSMNQGSIVDELKIKIGDPIEVVFINQ